MKHLKYKENRVAAALRRKMHSVYEIQLSQTQFNLPRIMKKTSLKDLEYAFL